MIRFCTSRSLNTSTTSTRFSESPTNSIWVIEATAGLDTVTTPARRVTFESNWEALATKAFGFSFAETSR